MKVVAIGFNSPMTRSEWLILLSGGLGVLHHIDHVLRFDHSGWPFREIVTPFTYSLLVYPLLAVAFFWRRGSGPVIGDAGHESRKLARTLKQHQGWQLRIVKRRQRAFKIAGLTWIVERSFAWMGRNRRLSKDYKYRVQTSETMIALAAIRLMLNRIAPV